MPGKSIDEFPFVNDSGQVVFKVGFSGGNADLRKAARRFNEYFAYCQEKHLVNGDGLCGLVTDPDSGESGLIRLQLSDGVNAILPDSGGGILISAPDIAGLNKLITALFYRMDKRFEHFIPFHPVEGMDPGEFQANGKSLPLRRFFD